MVAMFIIRVVNFGCIMFRYKIGERGVMIPDHVFIIMVDEPG